MTMIRHPIAALAAVFAALGCLGVSHAQTGGKSDPSIRAPSDPGMKSMPDKSMKAPSNSGIVVVPPKTASDAMVTAPPRRVDPKIDDATPDIDKKNAEKSQDKDAK
jgi:hypothetical protein